MLNQNSASQSCCAIEIVCSNVSASIQRLEFRFSRIARIELGRPLPGRFVGQRAKVRLVTGVAAQDGTPRRNYTGTIRGVSSDDASVTLDVDGTPHILPLGDLERAHLEWQF